MTASNTQWDSALDAASKAITRRMRRQLSRFGFDNRDVNIEQRAFAEAVMIVRRLMVGVGA